MSIALAPIIKEVATSGATSELVSALTKRLATRTATESVKGNAVDFKQAFGIISGFAKNHQEEAVKIICNMDVDHQNFLLKLADQHAEKVDSDVLQTIVQSKGEVTAVVIEQVGNAAGKAMLVGGALLIIKTIADAYTRGKELDNMSFLERVFGSSGR